MRLLVAIASYGHANDFHLLRVIREYRAMSCHVDIIVLSNIAKTLPEGIELSVGTPSKNPWTLPFAHKPIFANRVNQYDLFLYSEDDILITEDNLQSFVDVTECLRNDEIAGFLRIEKGENGQTFFPEVHHRFHWDITSVEVRDKYTFASFTNEHSGCYVLTREQLRRAISSGGFLVKPHTDGYDLLCTAATDPYTQCGLNKLICVSHLDHFLVHHLPNKYLDRMGTNECEVRRQIDELLTIARGDTSPRSLLEMRSAGMCLPFSTYYLKNYYEQARTDIVSQIPDCVTSVLSVGCGWGETERLLAARGLDVAAIPLDQVIGACAAARHIEVIQADLTNINQLLEGRRFDCLLISRLLHLLPNPTGVLASLSRLLSQQAIVIVVVPNFLNAAWLWRIICKTLLLQDVVGYNAVGVHFTSIMTVRRWMKQAGLQVRSVSHILPDRHPRSRLAKWLTLLFAEELLAVAMRD
jgi:2-polyprenyl-3-methyl-5-hydroxy-6-metoxy-1,4-benzoquinol methylase